MLVYSQEVMVVLIKTNPFLQELAELNHLSAFEIIIIIIQISNKSKFRESKSVFFNLILHSNSLCVAESIAQVCALITPYSIRGLVNNDVCQVSAQRG